MPLFLLLVLVYGIMGLTCAVSRQVRKLNSVVRIVGYALLNVYLITFLLIALDSGRYGRPHYAMDNFGYLALLTRYVLVNGGQTILLSVGISLWAMRGQERNPPPHPLMGA